MIREVTKKDYERIYELGNLLHTDYKKLYDLDKLEKEFYFKLYVYCIKDLVVGFIMANVMPDFVDIIDLVVDEDYRNQKVATNLVDYLISILKETQKIFLEVSVDNEPAIKLYQKFGFEVINTRKKYYNDLIDAYVMERRIDS